MVDQHTTLSIRRDIHDQEMMIAQITYVTVEFTKPFLRMQSDILSMWANAVQVFVKMYLTQADAFVQYGAHQTNAMDTK